MIKFKFIAGTLLGLTALLASSAAFAQAAPVDITPPGGLTEVPRNQTLILANGGAETIGITNPWVIPGYTHQTGNAFMWEPLMYYGIYSDEYIPWLAESMEYTSDDFTTLEIKLNPLAEWSDGTPVTAADVIYTFDGQAKDERLPYHAAFLQFYDSAVAKDDKTIEVKFKIPAPRFKFEVLCLKFDTGIPIVPAAWESAQPDYSTAVGGTEIPHSGPYDLIAWNATQKIYDLREGWWAVKAGLMPEPAVKRIIVSNLANVGMDLVAQRVTNNEFDSTLDMRAQVIGNILAQNPKVQSWTGNESPYGYLDWWPNSLWMNTQIEPYSDPNVRKAMSLSINRDQINEVLYDGAQIATIYPFPLSPGLQKFADSPAVKALEAQYNPGEFNLDKSAELMTAAGFVKNGDGMWEKNGETINATINGFEGIHGDIVPVLVEQLRNGGFDAETNFGTDAYQNMADGKPGLYMFGHGASLQDPYAALELFHGRFSDAIGTTAGNNRFSRYKNPELDALLDDAAMRGSDDPKFQEDLANALGIYWRDTIDVPVIQWLHRIPYNTTYWTNWPSSTNPAMGTNGAFWAHTGLLVVAGLTPSGAN